MFFDDSRPDRRKRAARQQGGADRLRALASSPVPPPKAYELFGLDEVLHGERTAIFDVESYPNYFECGFKCIETGKILYFEITPEGYTINGFVVNINTWMNYLTFVLYRWLIVGFNSRNYDLPMLLVAIQGTTALKLFEIGQEIIQQEMRPFEIERKYNVKALHVNHIDLIEVAPISASLKIYSGRLHCERMQDLPYEVGSNLTFEQACHVRDYNINDLDNTQLLFNHLMNFIKMREELGIEYQQDLRSKSDAQIAETVIVSELEKLGPVGKPRHYEIGETFQYKVPDWLEFQSPQLIQLHKFIGEIPFEIGSGGKPRFPQNLKELGASYPDLQIRVKEKSGIKSHVIQFILGNNFYTVAMGGLHSNEESVAYKADEDNWIIDRDVASYYPYIVLNNRLFPEHLGEAFLEVYRSLVMRRLKLKAEKNSLEAGLKIAINGTFGKLGNFYSRMYAPDLLTQVTITGQLALLMQIEMVERAGIMAISANTDGAVYLCPKSEYKTFENTLTMWEGKTGFVTEETRYAGLYSRDVNNYIAVKELRPGKNEPEVKTKGAYSERGSAQNSVLSKNPEALICSDAVQQYLANGVPLHQTIRDCKDIRRFVSVRTVKGGAEKNGIYLGKAVRWYYAKDEVGTINYALSGNKVAKSEGAKPLMTLTTELPLDLDIDWYINEALEILYEVGYYQRAKIQKLF